MRALIHLLAVALLAASITGCTGRTEHPAQAQPDRPTSSRGPAPTAPPAALEGQPLGPSAVIFPWDWDWRTERR
jgi:hypothetical protein